MWLPGAALDGSGSGESLDMSRQPKLDDDGEGIDPQTKPCRLATHVPHTRRQVELEVRTQPQANRTAVFVPDHMHEPTSLHGCV